MVNNPYGEPQFLAQLVKNSPKAAVESRSRFLVVLWKLGLPQPQPPPASEVAVTLHLTESLPGAFLNWSKGDISELG